MLKNRFIRSASLLAGGTAAAQAIEVLASPLLTRLYGPEGFGVLAVYMSLLTTISVVASLRYQMAIPLPAEDQEAAHVFVLSVLAVLAMAFLTALIIFFFRQSVTNLLGSPSLGGLLWLLPVGVLFTGIYQVFNYWAIRTRAFAPISRTKLSQSLSMVAVQLGGSSAGPVALLIGHVAGQAAGLTSLATLVVRKRFDIFRSVKAEGMVKAAKRFHKFPVYSTWAGALNTASIQLPQLLFAGLFSPAVSGLYMLAHRVLALPISLIGGAVADVFFSRATDARHDGTLAPLVATIHDRLAHIAMPPTLIVVLTGPELFVLVFGSAWQQAGEMAQWMAPWLYFVFLTSPLSLLFPVLEKQGYEILFQGSLLVTRLCAMVIGASLLDVKGTVILFSLGSLLFYIAVLIWEVRISGNKWPVIWRSTFRAALISIALLSPLLIAQIADFEGRMWVFALGLSAVLIAIRYLYLLREVW